MDRLTATIMLANDPSLALVFRPAGEYKENYLSYAYCSNCATHKSEDGIIDSKWVDVVYGNRSADVVAAQEVDYIVGLSECELCDKPF